MANRRQFLIGGAATGVIAPALAAHAAPPALRGHLKREMDKQLIPAMQVAVVRHGMVCFLETLGQADIENAVAATDVTVFQIASCTKAFIGVAIMQLVESGKLDLGAPITRYLDDLPAAWRAVTVGHAASHTSGLPDITSNLAELRLLVEGDSEASWQKVKTLPMVFTPGDKFSYVQTNYVVLGKIIDLLAGEPFADYVRKHQFDAAGMHRTVFGDDHDVVLHSARTYTPYTSLGGTLHRTDTLYKTYIQFPAMLRTCGGLNSTAGEMANWIIALLNGKLLREKSSLETLWTSRLLNDGKRGAWGIGGWVFQRNHPVYFSIGAAKSAFAIYPKDDLAVVALTNLSADMWLPVVDGIAAHYVPDIARD